MAELRATLEHLSEYFVLSDPSEAGFLEGLRERFSALKVLGMPAPASAGVEGALALIDKLLRGEGDRRAGGLTLHRTISALQARLIQGKSAEAAPFPTDLGIPTEAAAAATPALFSWPQEADLELMGGFTAEAKEHLDASDTHLLTLESAPGNMEALNAVFRAFHTIKGAAGYLELGEIRVLAHETETLLDLARKGGIQLSGSTMDATFEAVDAMKLLVAGVEGFLKSGAPPSATLSLPALVERIQRIATGKTFAAPPMPAASPDPVIPVFVQPPAASSPTKPAEGPKPPICDSSMRETVKVDAERLDRLVDLIGELVIAESMVGQSPDLRDLALTSPLLAKQITQLDKITRGLQEMGMSLRMVPVRPLFQRMARVARDLSKKLGKPIEFASSGDDIEVDKAVVDRVADPLIHIIRNSLDHGIEERPEDRRKAGKPEAGRIELRAFHREGNIVIEVEDDGRGMNREAILAKGIEKGLVRAGEVLSEREIFQMIFLPGFSTAKVVTEVSGRGVGMDVVRKNIEALRGKIEIQSQPRKGSVISLRLPLTLAIIEGMVVRVGTERYIIPTLSVTRLVQAEQRQISSILNRGEMLGLQGAHLPLFRLHRLLRVPNQPQDPARSVAVVVEDGGHRAALLADELLGQQQIVIKTLGDSMEHVTGVAGGAILPDGQVGLILDVAGVLRLAHQESAAQVPQEAA